MKNAPFIGNIINACLNENPKKRPNATSLLKLVPSYEEVLKIVEADLKENTSKKKYESWIE